MNNAQTNLLLIAALLMFLWEFYRDRDPESPA
jgi:hypothetical protein